MIHKDVYKKFEEYFPSYASKSDVWFPAGKNRIRIRMKNKKEYVFQYDGENNMEFKTINRFIDEMKGENK